MTDLQKFIDLYKSLDIELKINETKEGSFLELVEGSHKQFTGYYGFGSRIVFDKNEKFIEQSFWE